MSALLTVSNDKAVFAGTLDFIYFNDRTVTLKHIAHHLFIGLARLFGGLEKKPLVGYLLDISFLLRGRVGIGKVAFRHKVTPKLGRAIRRGYTIRSVGFKTICMISIRSVEILFINSIKHHQGDKSVNSPQRQLLLLLVFIVRAIQLRDARFRRVNIDTKVVGFFDKVEIQNVLLLGVGFDLCTVESQYMVTDCVHRFHTKVVIVDPEIAKQVT